MVEYQETRLISEIVVGKRFRKWPAEAEIRAFAERIRELGVLLHPVVISPTNKLIAGLRVPVRVVALADLEAGQVAENVDRLPFLPSEIAAIADGLWNKVATPWMT